MRNCCTVSDSCCSCRDVAVAPSVFYLLFWLFVICSTGEQIARVRSTTSGHTPLVIIMMRSVTIPEDETAKLAKLKPALDDFQEALEAAEAMLIR